ncbi:hypothetical protein AO072_13140 [Pseudomonas syringae ICMP 13102]|nr:hypothetical protein AO072_13140 [Pseudomonas syringae ICMP 13102]
MTDNGADAEYFFSKKTEFRAMIIVPTLSAHRYTQALKSPKYRADTPMILVPTLRVVMHFVTLCVTLQPWRIIRFGPRYRQRQSLRLLCA